MKYLYMARKRGHPGRGREPVPRARAGALLGAVERRERAVRHPAWPTEFFQVHQGGDIAFLTGVLKVLIEEGCGRPTFIARAHRRAVEELRERVRRPLARRPGAAERASRTRACAASPSCTRDAETAVLVWTMGITQHVCGGDNVRAILNLALARGNVGRPGAGLMPIRGHSGVQGGAEMGAYATAFPGGVPITPDVGRGARGAVRLPGRRTRRALTAAEMVEAAGRGELDVLYVRRRQLPATRCPTRRRSPTALGRVPLRVHQDIVPHRSRCSSTRRARCSCCPRQTRYEQRRRRHRDDHRAPRRVQPRDPRPRSGEARAEWQIYAGPRRRGRPRSGAHLLGCRRRPGHPRGDRPGRALLRRHPAPARRPATRSSGAARACATGGVFPTPDGKAHFPPVHAAGPEPPPRGASCSARGAASSSTPWSGSGPGPADRRRPRRAVHGRRRMRAGWGSPRARGRRALGGTARSGHASTSRRSAPATSRCSGPSATR